MIKDLWDDDENEEIEDEEEDYKKLQVIRILARKETIASIERGDLQPDPQPTTNVPGTKKIKKRTDPEWTPFDDD